MQNLVSDINTADTWIRYMRHGMFEEAWKFSDQVLKAGINRDYLNLPRHYQCIWDGTPLAGKKVLIRCYHGLGDTIQFIRYAPLVKEISRQVIVWAQPDLIDLLRTVNGIDLLLPLHNASPSVSYDVDVEVMELPHVFRSTISNIPVNIPYFHVKPVELSPGKEKLKVGLVWQAGDWDPSRNVPFSELVSLFERKEIDFYILQPRAAEAGWREGLGYNPGEHNLTDFARILAGMDLLITVDSMAAHLGGALNVPVWLLLKENADWRWMEKRSDSPWYPSMRLFRQEKHGDWLGVSAMIAKELSVLRRMA
ncbi:MAG TPA: hypothetical protein VHO90_13015 [Bacteroidales bacterium]|nr:hypothetical protein [Bacteroidales bacterium]